MEFKKWYEYFFNPYIYHTPVYYCKTFIIRINYYSFNVVKQKALTRMNNINLQVIETVDYLIDVGVDEVHVCSDTTEDDVGDFEIRDEGLEI